VIVRSFVVFAVPDFNMLVIPSPYGQTWAERDCKTGDERDSAKPPSSKNRTIDDAGLSVPLPHKSALLPPSMLRFVELVSHWY
jgi:hypothetical protein